MPKVKPEDFAAKIDELKMMFARNERLDRPAVEAEVNRFADLTQIQIDGVMKGLKFPLVIKPKSKALAAIVTHILAEQTSADRNTH